jgi:hypothetical protein
LQSPRLLGTTRVQTTQIVEYPLAGKCSINDEAYWSAPDRLLHLDYISCFLTVASTVLVGRRLWQGWVIAGVNSIIICVIGFRTGQMGFVPANLFCLAMYGYNIFQWTSGSGSLPVASDRLSRNSHSPRRFVRAVAHSMNADGFAIRTRDRIRKRALPR